MVDDVLLNACSDTRPLRVLFLDLNAYFASVEQQEHPELRGKPVAVVPVEVDTSFVIAASYEAKAFGVKTGTRIGDARRMCPGLICVSSGHSHYSRYHDRVIAAAESVLPIHKVRSIDEMECRLIGDEQHPERARELALRIKAAIAEQVGECMRCSIGIAPNSFLAKIGTELQKPNGLVLLPSEELPGRLLSLDLMDLPGINRRMQARIQARGIFTVEQLYNATAEQLEAAFGSVIGARWWWLLRGYELTEEKEVPQKSLGHSHVLAPELRTEDGVRQVLLRLVSKATARLRAEGLWAESVGVHVHGKTSWKAHTRMAPGQDQHRITQTVLGLWESRSFSGPLRVGVTFSDLRVPEAVTPSLFEDPIDDGGFSRALDSINARFGKSSVYLASLSDARNAAPERVAFAKTHLFEEGLLDHAEK